MSEKRRVMKENEPIIQGKTRVRDLKWLTRIRDLKWLTRSSMSNIISVKKKRIN